MTAPRGSWPRSRYRSSPGGGDRLELVALQLAAEWSTLYENGIVPQKPRKVARALLKAGEP